MADLLDFDTALTRILAAATPLGTVEHQLADAAGHCLAEPIFARLTQPPFDASAMDGYAVVADAVVPNLPMPVAGRSEAGNGFAGTCPRGAAIRIFTGAPLPAGTDTVVMQEDVVADGDRVTLSVRPNPGQHIRRRGSDFAEGAPLLAKGTRLTPGALSLAAASGHGTLAVTRRPRLALLMTGDELVPPGTKPGPDRIVASNGAGLFGLLAPLCRRIDDLGIAGDDEAVLGAHLAAALAGDADVIVTTGGASVGDRDFVKKVLGDLGAPPDLWRIAMRPGKPLMFARHGDKLVFGLPGNPVSALTTAVTLLVPALRALAGDADPGPHLVTLPLAEALGPNGPRRHFHRARLVDTESGLLVAPLPETDSAHLSSFARADALIVHHELSPALAAGTPVKVLFLGAVTPR
ncbi:MAG: molybdopterin molybdotransferase MoeA [Alphaproteobacteria bacterium]|nr:molybdopterin molybdotransferase MoeA [Alphaproteobacteria bacterium]